MIFKEKRYNTLNEELKKQFGQKIVKLSLDGGFTCPTRDGTKGRGGCIFCSARGSGEFAGDSSKIESYDNIRLSNFSNKNFDEENSLIKSNFLSNESLILDEEDSSIRNDSLLEGSFFNNSNLQNFNTEIINKIDIDSQIKNQIRLLSDKWKDVKYIGYFQNFTNTYADKSYLFELYKKVLDTKDIVGLSIATRPDCLGDDVLEVLDYFNKKTYLFVELGLQSIHKKTSDFIRRGYELSEFDKAVEKLNNLNIKVAAHTIVGLPTEDKGQMLQTYDYLNSKKIWGIKIQQLNILKNTDLAKYYEKNRFYLMSADEYIEFVCDIIERLRQDIVIHRLTGDGSKEELIEPRWILNKRYVLNGIDKELKSRQSFQGKKYTIIY